MCDKNRSLSQALCQCGRSKKQAGDERGLVEKEGATPSPVHSRIRRSQLIPLVTRSLFRSPSLTEGLEQATRAEEITYDNLREANET